MSIHSVKREQAHLAWDNTLPPVLSISSGDVVSFDCLDASNGQITASSLSPAAVSSMDFSRLDQVNGPVYVAGAKPGDVLKVELLELVPADWGWTAIVPGFGLLADEFPDAAIRIWSIDKEVGHASTVLGGRTIRLPIRPFMGEVGLARGEPGKWSTIPPYRTGVRNRAASVIVLVNDASAGKYGHKAPYERFDSLPPDRSRRRSFLDSTLR